MTQSEDNATVVVGGGHAAGTLLTTLIQKKYPGEVVLVGEEPHPPYQRPPLSKDYLAGESELEALYLRPRSAYEDAHHKLMLGERVEGIDRQSKQLTLASGQTLPYGRLILATGSKVRRLNAPGSDLKGIHYLRNIDNVNALREQFKPGKRLVIVGGGYIGLEVAAVAVKAGLNVTVLEAAERVMQRVAGPEIAGFFHKKHTQAGVDVRTGTAVTGFAAADDGHVSGVTIADGSTIAADFVLVCVGVAPETELAEAAGLACDDGIVVDEYTRTSDPDIFAIGDCSRHRNLFLDEPQRMESVSNAVEQARCAASNLLGVDKPYNAIPWFWSNQYDVRLQMAGMARGDEQTVLRGNPEAESFAVFHVADGQLIAVHAVNMPAAYLGGRKLAFQRVAVAPEQLADPSVKLKSLL